MTLIKMFVTKYTSLFFLFLFSLCIVMPQSFSAEGSEPPPFLNEYKQVSNPYEQISNSPDNEEGSALYKKLKKIINDATNNNEIEDIKESAALFSSVDINEDLCKRFTIFGDSDVFLINDKTKIRVIQDRGATHCALAITVLESASRKRLWGSYEPLAKIHCDKVYLSKDKKLI